MLYVTNPVWKAVLVCVHKYTIVWKEGWELWGGSCFPVNNVSVMLYVMIRVPELDLCHDQYHCVILDNLKGVDQYS